MSVSPCVFSPFFPVFIVSLVGIRSFRERSVVRSSTSHQVTPSAHSQPEDELVTDTLTLFSDGNPKKGARGREKNTTSKMSDPESYRNPPGESATERNNRLQRIHRHWAKKWYNYENVCKKYQILFAFTPPWNDCIAESCFCPDDEKVRLP